MDKSILSTKSENDSFYSKETANTVSDSEELSSERYCFSMSKAIKVISEIYTIISHNNTKGKTDRIVKRDLFYSNYIPKISIEDYIQRIVKFSQIEISTLVNSLIYVDKITSKKEIILTYNNIHRLILASIVLSTKYNEDKILKNKYYAKIGGVKNEELVNMQLKFLEYINYSLFIKESEYEKFYNVIKNTNISGYEIDDNS